LLDGRRLATYNASSVKIGRNTEGSIRRQVTLGATPEWRRMEIKPRRVKPMKQIDFIGPGKT
jgi:hypothetical protein